jgi:hypothetical protein
MMKKMKSTRALRAAAASLALIGITALPLQAFAHDEKAEKAEVPVAGVTSSDDMTVVRDATTGKLRMPTAKEHSDLQLKQQQQLQTGRSIQARVAPGRTLQKWHANGAVGARLTDEHMSSVVMVRKADGSLEKQCFESSDAADVAVKAHAIVGTSAATKLETE